MYEDITEISSRGGESGPNCYQVTPYMITPRQAIIDRLRDDSQPYPFISQELDPVMYISGSSYLEPVQILTQDREETTDQVLAGEEIVDTYQKLYMYRRY